RHQLAALRIVDRVFGQRLAESVGDRALHLAFDNDGIEHDAGIVDSGIGHEVDSAGVGVDLDLGDMTAVRKSERRLSLFLGVETFTDLLGASRCLEQRNLAVGADDFEIAAAVLNVRLRRLQQRRSDFLAFDEHYVGRVQDCAAGTHRRARANRSKTRKSLRRVAVTMLYFFWLDAELAGEQAWKNCGMALA